MACQSPSTMATNSHDSWLLMWISDLDRGKNLPEIPNSIGKKNYGFRFQFWKTRPIVVNLRPNDPAVKAPGQDKIHRAEWWGCPTEHAWVTITFAKW
jgi:hypothetical protein